MFGFFKKKNTPQNTASQDALVAQSAAQVLETMLMICRSVENYQEKLHSNFVRGYLIGFFDGCAQHAGIKFNSDEEFFIFLAKGHSNLLKADVQDPINFTLSSLKLQGNSEFDQAQFKGGSECFSLMSGGNERPIVLAGYFHEF